MVRLLLVALGPLAFALAGCDIGPPSGAPIPATAPAPAARPPVQAATAAATAEHGWNAAQIDWQPYEAGLAKAKAENKPTCLVLYTDWCPHCRNYSHVFEDAKVVAQAKRFVMIHLNADQEGEVSRKFAADGGYVPRTYFLAPDGTVQADVHAQRPKFVYFYDENDPGSLLGGMTAALAKLGK